MNLTETQLTAAGFPDALRPYLLNGTLVFSHARPDGTLEFMVPNEAEPKSAFTLVWHTKQMDTFDYMDTRFYVREERFRDVDHTEPLGSDLVDFGENNDVPDLCDWLDELPGKVLPPVPAAVGDESGTQETRKAGAQDAALMDFANRVLDLMVGCDWDSDKTAELCRQAASLGLVERNPDYSVDAALEADEHIPELRRTQATAPAESEGRKARTAEPNQRWFIVCGRAWGDDDDSSLAYNVSDKAAACDAFIAEMRKDTATPEGPMPVGPGHIFINQVWDCGATEPQYA